MFRELRRKDRETSGDEAIRLLSEGEFGVLGTSDSDGYPYTTPLSYVYKDNKLYFHGAPEGHKLDNIKSNNKVSFCVVGNTKVLPEKFSTVYESVIVFGKAEVIQGPEKLAALEALIGKYSSSFTKEGLEYINRAAEKTCVVRIDIERMTSKARGQ